MASARFQLIVERKHWSRDLSVQVAYAEVERGFSESGKRVTDDRVRLSEASINGIRATTDGLKAFKGPGSVPITK